MARRKPIIEEPIVEVEEVVEIEEPKKPAKKVTKKNNVKITFPAVNIRKYSSLASDIIGVALEGEKFELINSEGFGFYEIDYKGSPAFVSKEFSTLV